MARARKPVRAAFGGGQIPTIACINKATVPLGVPFRPLVRTLQAFVDRCLSPAWGTPCRIVAAPDFVPGAWALVFLDTADVQGALGYHDLTPDGLPLSKVFVKTTLKAGEQVSVTASHELAEMLVDPAVNLWVDAPKGVLWAYEAADAVESVTFELGGIPMSDFVYPAFFELFRKPGSTQFDYCAKVRRPMQLLPGGYTLVRSGGAVRYVYGSAAARRRIEAEDRRGHRSQFRRSRREPSVRSRQA